MNPEDEQVFFRNITQRTHRLYSNEIEIKFDSNISQYLMFSGLVKAQNCHILNSLRFISFLNPHFFMSMMHVINSLTGIRDLCRDNKSLRSVALATYATKLTYVTV